MANETDATGDWAAAMQKAQADMLRQWTDMGQAWARNSSAGTAGASPGPSPGPGTGSGAGIAMGSMSSGDGLARHFLQQCEQYLGVSRSLWDLVTRSAAVPDSEQRARSFADGLAGLQQQFAGLWAATPFGAPPTAGFGMPGMGGLPGMGSPFNIPTGMPSLGPAREQQELWQRLAQLGTRCSLAQAQVSGQWNDIIGKALRELGERLAPRLKGGAAPGSMKEIYDLWVDAAEGVYAQAARGAAFAQAQAELTNSMSQLRTVQRELLEEWAKQFDLPTRAELNSIHQQLRDLKAALKGTRG